MGWLNNADITQNLIRRFVFASCIVFASCSLPGKMEVLEDNPFPPGDIAVVGMDGVDVVSKVMGDAKTFKGVYRALRW